MTFGRATPTRMDLAAFRLDEVEETRPGVFRHRRSLRARIDRLFHGWARTGTELLSHAHTGDENGR